jgi:hypothetical protein
MLRRGAAPSLSLLLPCSSELACTVCDGPDEQEQRHGPRHALKGKLHGAPVLLLIDPVMGGSGAGVNMRAGM